MVDKIVEILKEHGFKSFVYTKPTIAIYEEDLEKFVTAIAHLYSAGEEVSDLDIEKEMRQAFIHGQGNREMMEAGLERDEVDDYIRSRMYAISKLTRPTVTEGEIEQAWKSWMCTLDNLAKDEQVMLEGDFYAAIKELIDKR